MLISKNSICIVLRNIRFSFPANTETNYYTNYTYEY